MTNWFNRNFGYRLLVLIAFVICADVRGAGSGPVNPLPGMPPILDPNDIYSETHAGKLSPTVRGFPELIYVPNSGSNTVDVIDAHNYRIVNRFKVGRQPQHVTPSYDLKTLWVLNDLGDSLIRIDPATGKKGQTVRVKDPYNMYYTPDGKYAIVVAERVHRLDFRDPTSMALVYSIPVPCRGIDHIDFSADGQYLIASCEFSGTLIKLTIEKRAVVGTLALVRDSDGGTTLGPTTPKRGIGRVAMERAYDRKHAPTGSMPQDVKTSPDGKVFYVADMLANGVYMIDGERFVSLGFIPTGSGAHGLYVSRDSKLSNT